MINWGSLHIYRCHFRFLGFLLLALLFLFLAVSISFVPVRYQSRFLFLGLPDAWMHHRSFMYKVLIGWFEGYWKVLLLWCGLHFGVDVGSKGRRPGEVVLGFWLERELEK